jgi:peptidyl-prolyl cis-trans isomerase SurA
LHILRVNARRGDTIDYNHILIAFDPRKNDPGPAIEFLNTLRDSVLTGGASFALLAREFSEEESSAAMGGRVTDPNTGERDLFLNNLGGRWQSTVLGLEEGDISRPEEVDLLDGSLAYHIVLLEKRVPPHVVDLETDYPLIKAAAERDKQSRVMEAWLSDLRKEVYIDMRGSAREVSIADN